MDFWVARRKPVRTVAIGVLAADGYEFLQRTLPGVVETAPSGAQVYLLYNSVRLPPPDLNRLVGHPVARSIVYYPFRKNVGFAGAYNFLARVSREDVMVLINHDVRVSPGWLEPLIDALNAYPELAGVQPKIRSWRNPEYFEYAGACGGWLDILGIPFCRGRIFHHLERDQNQYNTAVYVFWTSGACMVIRRQDYLEAGGLDLRFFMHMEEIDLCWRIQIQLGLRFACIPQSTVYHWGGASLSYTSPRKLYLNLRNNYGMLWKNLPGIQRWIRYVIRVGMDSGVLLQGASASFREQIRAWIRAHRDAWLLFGTGNGREIPELPRKERVLYGLYPGSIVLAWLQAEEPTFSRIVPENWVRSLA